MGRYYWLMQQRSLLALFLGQVISRLGDGMFKLALAWIVWTKTSSPALVALALIAQTVPPLLFSFAAGIVADRTVHRNQMIATDVVRMVVTATLAVVGWSGGINHWHLILTGFLLSSGSTFFGPARAAIVPLLVPKEYLGAANGLMSGSFHAAMLIGPLIGGFLLRFTTAPALLMVDALTFAVSLVTLLMLPATSSRGRRHGSIYGDAGEGLAVVRRNPSLLWVVGTFGIGTFLSGSVGDVGQILLMDHIGGGPTGLALMSTALGIGLAIGSFLVGRAVVHHHARVVMLAWAADGLLLVLLGLSPSLWVALLLAFFSGIIVAYINVPTESLIQMHGQGNTGKVFSYWNISIWLGQTAGLAVLSPLFRRLPLPTVFAIGGLTLSVLALVGVKRCWSLTDESREAIALPESS